MKPIIKEKKVKKKKFSWAGFLKYFRTLWKNDACVECSIVPRKKNNYTGAKYWWISIPVFLSAIVLAMTPLTVHASQRTGSTAFAQRTYGVDEVLYDALSDEEGNDSFIDLAGNIGDLKFEDHKASIDVTDLKYRIDDGAAGYAYIGFHKSLKSNAEQTTHTLVKDFDIYFVENDEDAKKFKETIKNLTEKTSVLNSDMVSINLDPSTRIARDCSFLVFSPKQVTLHIHGINTQSGSGSIVGDFEHIANTTFKEFMTKNSESKLTTSIIMKNFKKFADQIYENNRIAITAAQSGISLAVNGGVTILLGFIMFFLTRGKQNPNRYIKWYETLNMAMWASFLPGLIALVLGFFFSGMEMMLFLITFGFRAMWMSMRNLRPQSY